LKETLSTPAQSNDVSALAVPDMLTGVRKFILHNDRACVRGNGMSNINQVEIVDIKMPFMSMVVFMVKAAIAAIPALIILTIIFALVTTLFGGFVGGFIGRAG
jgi:hypothetical protein